MNIAVTLNNYDGGLILFDGFPQKPTKPAGASGGVLFIFTILLTLTSEFLQGQEAHVAFQGHRGASLLEWVEWWLPK